MEGIIKMVEELTKSRLLHVSGEAAVMGALDTKRQFCFALYWEQSEKKRNGEIMAGQMTLGRILKHIWRSSTQMIMKR